MAALCDVFVMDAFGTAHRAQASTYGVAEYRACRLRRTAAGRRSSTALDKALERPAPANGGDRRRVESLHQARRCSSALAGIVDILIVGGGIANTFIAAAGHDVGQSLHEADMLDIARQLAAGGEFGRAEIPVPTDVVVAHRIRERSRATVKARGCGLATTT